ncbi:TPA: hypothetical protein P7W98_004619 [Escherichia coli]|mgnify:FL=1|uniref:hypothetical protein n=1 Tax=Enterobacteriaceae TaxID=543 RepID=UPI000DD53777|nr:MULTISPECIES: hypothetical protein [Enterobacteriaceae]EAP0713105.1 hypothetical protein [Salmonella enterica]EBH8760546.1 hypothetical protein [Salmonella enterica subsp. enterica serovar Larochelle]EBS6398918.1 hypothetical protein [Salmonella enterica subsp. enterica serovar Emek]EBV6071133.1 hypothetical protein [Salmonella enterica subsp. enterica serovar Hadar]EBW1866797.1 hypothetical protein [Salmonella enterica subsp. enterica serovar Mbandaka]EBZ4757074.1 hypothetical protein [Sa
MTEIKTECPDAAWLRTTLAEMAGDAFPVYDLPSLRVDPNSSTQLSALADRQAAREMRQAASDVEARRLDAARVVEGLKTEAERLRGLIADGKAALRAGEPVSPDAGVASFLLPDIEAELVVAEAAEADVARERDTLLQDADRRDAAAALALFNWAHSVRVQRIELLLKLAMDEATTLAEADGGRGLYRTVIAPDRRLNQIFATQGAIEILRRNRGMEGV